MSQQEVTWKDYVVELLRIKGWTQATLAEEVGVCEGTVSKWANGRVIPTGAARKVLLKLGGRK